MSCCNKKFFITENEKKNILGLYGLINEQEEKKAQIYGNSFFGDGKWKELNPETIKNLATQTQEAIKFLGNNKAQIGSIQITASESQVPNTDQEPGEGKGKALPVLELSRKRAETMKNYLLKQFQDAIKDGKISQMPTFAEPILLQGKTPYNSNNKNNPAYTQERYVKVDVSLKAITNPLECLDNMRIRVFYDGKGKHACDSAVFRISINGNILTNTIGVNYATLNNQALFNKVEQNQKENIRKSHVENPLNRTDLTDGKAGGMRSNEFIINSELAKKLVQPGTDGKIPTKFVLEVQCLNNQDVGGEYNNDKQFGEGCHGDALSIQVINGKKQVQPVLTYNPPRGRGQKIVFTTMNACGTEMK